jgi:hypothetical protein
MRVRFGPIGPRGLALLAVTGVVGVLLGVHGWSQHTTSRAIGSLGAGTSAATTPTVTRSAGTPPTAGPSAPAGTGAGKPGPLLSSQSFASYAFAIWPGTPSATANAALTGLTVRVHRQPTGLSITAGVNGQPASQAQFYPNGVRVYVVEATMGDDSGSSDYNLGDDGLVVTDSQGRIIS